MRYTCLFLLISMLAAGLFLRGVTSQSEIKIVENRQTNATVTVHAKGRGLPSVNFADGIEFETRTDKDQYAATTPKLLTSADFNSDGIADLITADERGSLKLYPGNADSIYRKGENGEQLNDFAVSPFQSSEVASEVSVSPDFLSAGDFNADGHADVLGARRGENILHLVTGDGMGNFAPDSEIRIDGVITALVAGEIGRADGQTDLAIAVTDNKGSHLLVFEHPEGAFRHKPEIINLPAPANELAIGNLDEDSYVDIAVASGNKLTLIQGRGQAYPWDLLNEYDIKRPLAKAQTRTLPSSIGSLAIGRFTEKRGDGLAILTTDGTLQTLESPSIKITLRSRRDSSKSNTGSIDFIPSGIDANKYGVLKGDLPKDAETAEKLGLFLANSSEAKEQPMRERSEKDAEKLKKLSPEEQAKLSKEGLLRAEEIRIRAKEGFLKMISPNPSAPLASWHLQTLSADARLSSAALSANTEKLITVRVSDSGKDELVLLDTNAKQIHLLAQTSKTEDQRLKTELVSFESETNPTAILPMRLNADSLSDLVVLREGSSQPSFVMSAPAQTFVVNTTDDLTAGVCSGSDPCSLRRAIIMAGQTPGADIISFNIGGGGVQTIKPTSELPIIQSTVTIDGTTQPGFNGKPLIEIKGSNLSSAGDGLRINGSGIVVRGLAINEFKSASGEGGNGISIFNYDGDSYSSGNIIEGNYLGLDPAGSLDKGNDAAGINIYDSDYNRIGGTTSAARNVMSGNGNPAQNKVGVGLSIIAGNYNLIKGNFIGTDAAGVIKVPNTEGVFLTGENNLVGGDEASAGNLVSGNGVPVSGENRCVGRGINVAILYTLDTGEPLTLYNNFRGNLIGTTFNGTAALGNCSQGIKFDPSTWTTVGSITENGRNTISGNNYDAVWCVNENSTVPGAFSQITGNNIGTDPSGTIAVPNDQRNIVPNGVVIVTETVQVTPGAGEFVNVGAPGGTTRGGACTGFCNLISGNEEAGIQRAGFGQVLITNNHIGTNRTGTAALPNKGIGVHSYYSNDVFIGAAFVSQDGTRTYGGNLISGNEIYGVLVDRINGNSSASNTKFFVVGNLIGTSTDGINAIPNNTGGFNERTGHGIEVSSNYGEGFIGNVEPLARNIVAGNKGGGILVRSSSKVSIFNNYVGLNQAGAALGNQTNGIVIHGKNTQVGGTADNQANFIKHNGKNGVLVYETSGGTSVTTRGNKVVGNSIADNGALGIELTKVYEFAESDGVTPNDCLDADEGPNLLQNHPLLFAPTFNGTVTVEGTLRSTPAKTYTIDFYSNTTVDSSKYGEGERHIGSKSVTTDGNGFIDFTFTSTATIASSQKITATATDAEGNTSEFSCAAGECTTGNLAAENLNALNEPSCITPIIVNVTTDEPDRNTADGHCDVDIILTGDQCSLRAAIQEANARNGFDFINFDIPGTGGHIIAPTTDPLPLITDRVFINGASQPGYYTDNLPKILLSGVNLSQVVGVGLSFGTGSGGTRGSTVIGLAFNRWRNAAIKFTNSTTSEIQSCHIGFDLGGAAAIGSGNADGIIIEASGDFRLGGPLPQDGNVISNSNVRGIVVKSSQNTLIQNNKIGTNINGTLAVPNLIGISLDSHTTKVRILENVVSGNSSLGIEINGSRPSVLNNTVANNLIGTTANSLFALPNGNFGIRIDDSTNNVIEGNTISGHNEQDNSAGISLESSADSNQFYNNKIGIGADGVMVIPNRYGIRIENSSSNQIGSVTKPVNKISGNIEAGIYIAGSPTIDLLQSTQNKIINNDIGNAAGNVKDGVRLDRNAKSNEISFNMISGSGGHGVLLLWGADDNSIHDNRIGTIAANKIGIKTTSSNNSIYTNTISASTDYNVLVGYLDESFSSTDFIQGNKIYDNRIENGKIGIAVTDGAKNNKIGVDGGNKILNHKEGAGVGILLGATFELEGGFPSGNEFYRNIVGESAPNAFSNKVGMVVSNARDNVIGSNTEGLGNIFISNEEDGIQITGDKSKGNLIDGNFVGFNPSSPSQSGGGNGRNGIYVFGATKNDIKNNRIGYNRANGISILNVSPPTGEHFSINLLGNHIGVYQTNATAVAIPNAKAGIKLENAQNVLIGVSNIASSEPKNVIAGNGEEGILIVGANSKQNLITRSFIGTSEFGTSGIGNGASGVSIYGGQENSIGGGAMGNIISGNAVNGVFINNSPRNKLFGNSIGVIRLGNVISKLQNNFDGIFVLESADTEIGGNQLALQNIIGGNARSGITIRGAGATRTQIRNNSIGMDRPRINLGNALHGVYITGGANNTNVGGRGVETGNRIFFNGTQISGGDGVKVDDTAGTGNLVDPNEIFGNAGLGIDIGASGITPNDPTDADTGANNLQNYPDIVSKQIVDNEMIVGFKVDSAPAHSDYGTDGIYVEFFKADASGEGEKFLGFAHYTVTDYNYGSPQTKYVNLGNMTTLGITANDKITSTASDAGNNTSEFMPVTALIYSISGKVSYRNLVAGGNPKPVAGVLLTATGASSASISSDSNGNYLLGDLSNENYTVTPTKTGGINGITAFDASLILRHVAAGGTGQNALTSIQRIAADTDNDGSITAFDATQILRYVAANGITPNTGQVGVWKFDPVSRDYSPLPGAIGNQNYEAVLVGEVDGDWAP